MQIIASKVEQQQSECQLASKVEQQQIQNQIEKNSLKKQESVIEQTIQKIFCHSCIDRTEIISKEFFYTFPNGTSVFFCNEQEKRLWVGIYKLSS